MNEKHRKIKNTEKAMDDFQDFFAREVIKPCFSSKDDADMAETLFSEALINAWEHGNQKDPGKNISISWRPLIGGGLSVSVRDEGEGFEPEDNPKLPHVTQKRGRGILIISEFADSVNYNEKGNEITFTFKGERPMEDKFFKGFLIVLGLDVDEKNAREELSIMRDHLVSVTTDKRYLQNQRDIYILINMAPFNVVTSTFFGDIGAALEIEQIKLIGLCGMQPTVERIAKRMNVIQGNRLKDPTEKIEENLYKIQPFDSLDQGFNSLIKNG